MGGSSLLEDPLGLALTCTGTLAAVLAYVESIKAVGPMRKKHGVAAPRTDGPPELQAVLRAQQNTLEFLVVVLPLLWMTAALVPRAGPVLALGGGVAWSLYRISFIRGYAQAPEKRLPGFYGSLNVLKFLLVTTVVGILYQLAKAIGQWTQ